MSDLISRQKAIDALGEKPVGETDWDLGCCNQWEWDTEILRTLPSAEPEREMGKWIDERPNCYTRKVYCSKCGQIALNEVKSEGNVYNPRNTFDFVLSNFCPNCGAEMMR